MAEITAQDLYNQLTPMSKMYYDQQFSKQYVPGKENILLSSQPEYNKMKAVYEAEQQVPEKSFLDSINIFGSASAAEPDKISSVSGTPGFQTVASPDGTISIVPVGQTNNLPFTSMATMDAANQFPILPSSSTLPLDAFKNTVAPMGVNTGITASSAAIPFGSPVDIAQGFTQNTPSDQGTNFQFLESANENEIDEVVDTRSGIAKLFEFLQRFSPVANIARGIESIRNRFDTRKAIRDDIIRDRQGTIDTIVSPRIMNIQPTAQDIARGGGSIPTGTTSRRTSPQSGMQAERTRTRDLGRMRGGVGR